MEISDQKGGLLPSSSSPRGSRFEMEFIGCSSICGLPASPDTLDSLSGSARTRPFQQGKAHASESALKPPFPARKTNCLLGPNTHGQVPIKRGLHLGRSSPAPSLVQRRSGIDARVATGLDWSRPRKALSDELQNVLWLGSLGSHWELNPAGYSCFPNCSRESRPPDQAAGRIRPRSL